METENKKNVETGAPGEATTLVLGGTGKTVSSK